MFWSFVEVFYSHWKCSIVVVNINYTYFVRGTIKLIGLITALTYHINETENVNTGRSIMMVTKKKKRKKKQL